MSTGGFATGRLLAGGELSEYERELAQSVPGIRAGFERLDINAWHLTETGIQVLQQRLAQGNYRIDLPEQAALLTVAWLLGQQCTEQAHDLIDTLLPFFDRLGFFPLPTSEPPVSGVQVHVCTAGEVRQQLATRPAHTRLAAQKQAVNVRLPLYDAAVAHFLQTYQDAWPCRHYPDGWHAQAATLCTRYEAACQAGTPGKGRAVELYALLAQCAEAPSTVTGRQVGRIRRIVDDFVGKHGRPDSPAHQAFRDRQRWQVAAPGHHLIAHAVSTRLARYPAEAAIADVAALCVPVTAEESHATELEEGTALPPAISRRLARCRSGTLAELVACGLITSGDALAKVLSTVTAQIGSASFHDPALRRLYGANYRAFRRRRSLLLLDLQHQISLDELPWVAAIETQRQRQGVAANAARETLIDTSALTLSAFPQAIIPNKLLQEFQALATSAQLDMPLVEEVAADIFMGTFSNKYIDVARRAARCLVDTLYARYYAIDLDQLMRLPDTPKADTQQPAWERPLQHDALALLCAQRANAPVDGGNVARNGTLIEQQQILTTHNLATLFCGLELKTLLATQLGALALVCFKWICVRQQVQMNCYHARLVMLKNTAYAWRQMVFFLSMLDEAGMRRSLEDIEAFFAEQSAAFQTRFSPVMTGLRLAVDGRRLPQHEMTAEGARVFLGWATGRHWLMQ
ncbi:hypothetical protein [Pseudomonas sp.]|uniref:hypothetical protein n=1 Tax=Pseudomonas sp. TaxID=306 RepID=UPI0028B1724E|nr:hypothetical protein [Pseudomonas sp.]